MYQQHLPQMSNIIILKTLRSFGKLLLALIAKNVYRKCQTYTEDIADFFVNEDYAEMSADINMLTIGSPD